MKINVSILAAAALLSASVNSFAIVAGQGVVLLDNLQSQGGNGTSAQFNSVDVSTVGGLPVFFEVLAAAYNGGSLLPSLDPSFVAVAGAANATVFQASTATGFEGTFSGGTGTSSFNATTGNAQFEVIAWVGANSSSTFNAASIRGVSSVWSQATGTPASSGPPPIAANPANLMIPDLHINLAVVPEPSTLALGVLGGLGLLMRRRK